MRKRRLLGDDQLERGDEVYDELSVQTQGIPDRAPPTPDLQLVLAQNLADQRLEGLGESRVRDVPLVLVELTRNEDATRQNVCLVQLVYDRGLTDARVAGYKHELRRPA